MNVFIEKLNLLAPSFEQIIQASEQNSEGVDIKLVRAIQDNYVFHYYGDRKQDGDVEELIYNTSIGNCEISSINFYDKINIEAGEYKCFANFNDHYDLCRRTTDLKIAFLDRYTLKPEILCNEFEILLEFLLILANYNTNKLFLVPLPIDFKERVDKLIEKGFSKKWIMILMPALHI